MDNKHSAVVHKKKIITTGGKTQYVYTLTTYKGKALRMFLSDIEVEDVYNIDWEPISDLILNLLSTSITEEEETTEVSEDSLANDVTSDVDASDASGDGGSSDGGGDSGGDSGGGDGGGE